MFSNLEMMLLKNHMIYKYFTKIRVCVQALNSDNLGTKFVFLNLDMMLLWLWVLVQVSHLTNLRTQFMFLAENEGFSVQIHVGVWMIMKFLSQVRELWWRVWVAWTWIWIWVVWNVVPRVLATCWKFTEIMWINSLIMLVNLLAHVFGVCFWFRVSVSLYIVYKYGLSDTKNVCLVHLKAI